jgi:hypothetical protein
MHPRAKMPLPVSGTIVVPVHLAKIGTMETFAQDRPP